QLWRYAVAQDYAKDGLGDLSHFALQVREFPQGYEAAEGALSDASAKDTLKVWLWHTCSVRVGREANGISLPVSKCPAGTREVDPFLPSPKAPQHRPTPRGRCMRL